ncbi:MAG: hypothetical protein WCS18_05240 [Sphaerochaetaceae bacterium]
MIKSIKKSNAILLVLMVLGAIGVVAGADNLTVLGVPPIIADLFANGGAMICPAFAITTEQTGLVIAYKNEELIADKVFPISEKKSSHLNFKWHKASLGDAFTVPDTQVGRKSRPNQVTFDGTDESGLARAFGLEYPVPQEDIDEAAPAISNYVNRKLLQLMDRVLLGREIRISSMAQNPANYASDQVYATAAGDKFTDSSSNPLKYLRAKMLKAYVRPTKVIFGPEAWEAFATHPKVVSAAFGNSGESGIATRERVAQLLEVSEVIVGKSWANSAKLGQKPVLERTWKDNVIMQYDSPLSDQEDGLAYARSVQIGARVVESYESKEQGLRGGFILKAGFYHGDVILNEYCGSLLTGVI